MNAANLGFTSKQKHELVEIFTDLFKEVVLPGLDDISVRLSKVEARLSSLEVRMKALEDKVEELKVVATLEQRVGIATA